MEIEDHDLLIEYLNGHLDASQARALEARLAEDEDLRAQLTFERRMQQALRSSPAFVKDRLARDTQPPRNRRWSWPVLVVPTAAALALAVALLPAATQPALEDAEPPPEFRTLTDVPGDRRCDELTVVAQDLAGLDSLLVDVDVDVDVDVGTVSRDVQTLSAVITVTDERRGELTTMLAADERVRLVIDACAQER